MAMTMYCNAVILAPQKMSYWRQQKKCCNIGASKKNGASKKIWRQQLPRRPAPAKKYGASFQEHAAVVGVIRGTDVFLHLHANL